MPAGTYCRTDQLRVLVDEESTLEVLCGATLAKQMRLPVPVYIYTCIIIYMYFFLGNDAGLLGE